MDTKRLDLANKMNDLRYHIEQSQDSADYFYGTGDMNSAEEKMIEVEELKSELAELEKEYDQLTKGKKPIISHEQIASIHFLLNTASLGLDNLFAGLQEAPTSIHDVPECFTKQDLKTLRKAADLINELQETFDGTRKQRTTP